MYLLLKMVVFHYYLLVYQRVYIPKISTFRFVDAIIKVALQLSIRQTAIQLFQVAAQALYQETFQSMKAAVALHSLAMHVDASCPSCPCFLVFRRFCATYKNAVQT